MRYVSVPERGHVTQVHLQNRLSVNHLVTMADWSMAAVVVAVVVALVSIPLFISDTAANRLSRVWAWTKRQVWPSGAFCEQMQWDDIPAGRLHECPANFYCTHWSHHRAERCWEKVMGVIFNRSWVSATRRAKCPKKPETLDFNRRYVLTDARTILAAFICSLVKEDNRVGSYRDELRCGKTVLRFHEDGGICVAHFTGQFREENSRLTKEDLDGIIRGYPPFYREFISVEHGPKVPHPIQSTDDISRAGWIVGAGLSKDPPFPFFFATDIAADQSFYKAMKRTLVVLEQNIAEKFPNNANVEAVVNAVRYMVVHHTGSGVERYLPGREVPGGALDQLNGKNCAFAIRIFNNFTPLSDEDVVQLRPILAPVLYAAFKGVYTVMQYIKNGDRHVVLHPLLRNQFQTIYLEDCMTSI
jgi:hypothetical protein